MSAARLRHAGARFSLEMGAARLGGRFRLRWMVSFDGRARFSFEMDGFVQMGGRGVNVWNERRARIPIRDTDSSRYRYRKRGKRKQESNIREHRRGNRIDLDGPRPDLPEGPFSTRAHSLI